VILGRLVAGGLALAGLAFSLCGPLERLAGSPGFAVHILQVSFLTLIAPPLLLLALPPRPIGPLLRRLSAPPVAGLLFTLHFALWHLPAVHARMLAQPAAHAAALAGFLATGLLAWWCVCAKAPAAGRVREPAGMAYLFVLGVPLQVIAGILTVSKAALYPGYGAEIRGFGLSPAADQQAGGVILWVPAGLVLWIAITALWLRWSRRIERDEAAADGADEAPPLTIPRF
jgi:putative membrane protein